MKSHHPSRAKGFTLVELLVVIVIIATLASVTFMVANRAIRSARATKDVGNLRQVGLLLNSKAAELGYFPVGYYPGERRSWVDTLIEDQVGEDSQITQMETFWSPLYERKIPLDLNREAVTHYGANPFILTDARTGDQTGGDQPQWIVRPAQLMRPSEQILLCGVSPKNPKSPYHMGNPIVEGMFRKVSGRITTDGTVPQSNSSGSESSVRLKQELAQNPQFNDLPDFHRYGTGKGQFLFVDGHIKSMAPTEHKEKHWAVSY